MSYQIVPEEQPAKIDWWTGQPLTYDVDHTDGYILIDAAGRERFVDASAPDIPGLSPKLKALLNVGGLHDLAHPCPPTGRSPTRWRRSAGCSAPTSPRRARDAAAPLRRTALVVPAALVLLAALTFAACGNGGGVTTLSAPPTTDSRSPSRCRSRPSGPSWPPAAATRSTTSSPTRRPTAPVLNDGCVFQWPPLVVHGPGARRQGPRPVPGRDAQAARRLDPGLLRRAPALHLQPRRHAGHGDRPGHRPGRRALVRASAPRASRSRRRSRSRAANQNG